MGRNSASLNNESNRQGCPYHHDGDSQSNDFVPVNQIHSKSELRKCPKADFEIPSKLSNAREESKIPSISGSGTYPSEKQFFKAAKMKGHDIDAEDMPIVVQIHNIVNEMSWKKIMEYEEFHKESCPTPKLIQFVGKPRDMTLKAKIMNFFGYEKPFDRHDWIVDRCGTSVKYIIDFYEGHPHPLRAASIHLDVRPDLRSPGSLRDRVRMFFKNSYLLSG